MHKTPSKTRAAGYRALTERYRLEVVPNWHSSRVGGSVHRIETMDGLTIETYPASHWPGDSPGDHLEFALKYDGTNLGILSRLFEVIGGDELLQFVRSKPTGKYARRLWYLYEFLTEKRLPLEDLQQGNYVDLLEPDEYYSLAGGQRIRRQRIMDNLLGDRRFCATVRRTKALREFEEKDLTNECRQLLTHYSPRTLKRALSYLYTKETKSSFEIEHIKPSGTRTERFVALLQLAEREDFVEKSRLVELQNRIVDERFAEMGYRSTQNYIGEGVAWQREIVHYVCPRPDDVPELMAGLVDCHQRLEQSDLSAGVHAAIIAYGFVFLHPFEDGNGRIHRFLIHNILARRGFSPPGIMFPVSAAMLNQASLYDASLETFSRPLMSLIDYDLDEDGRMTVHNETVAWYRFPDLTPQAEALFGFIEQTIDAELAEELAFLASYDEAKPAIQEVVDLPNRQIDLFIRFCLQNQGRLSARRRSSTFSFLTDDEVTRMEDSVQTAYLLETP